VEQKGDYDSEGRAILTRAELKNGSPSTSPRSTPIHSTKASKQHHWPDTRKEYWGAMIAPE
jgi:hypothetical protein